MLQEFATKYLHNGKPGFGLMGNLILLKSSGLCSGFENVRHKSKRAD